MVFDENYKNEVFGYLKSYDLSTLQNREIPENCSQNLQVLDQSFKHELIKIFAKRYAVKLFLPNVVGKGIAIYKALAYFKAGIASLGNKRIDVPVLDATSIGVSLLRKEFNTASNIMLMLKISELLEDYTRQKVTLQLGDSLMNKFDKVWIYKDGQEQEIAMSDLKQGQTVIVQTGSMVPIDGEIIDGEAMVNESSFTGEPLSKRVTLNDTVYAGTLIEEGKIFVKVRNLQDESRIAKIIDMIDTNESLKASIQSKAEHMADAIVPYSFLGFFGVWAFTRNLTSGFFSAMAAARISRSSFFVRSRGNFRSFTGTFPSSASSCSFLLPMTQISWKPPYRSARRNTISLPIPEEAPVTMAIFIALPSFLFQIYGYCGWSSFFRKPGCPRPPSVFLRPLRRSFVLLPGAV